MEQELIFRTRPYRDVPIALPPGTPEQAEGLRMGDVVGVFVELEAAAPPTHLLGDVLLVDGENLRVRCRHELHTADGVTRVRAGQDLYLLEEFIFHAIRPS